MRGFLCRRLCRKQTCTVTVIHHWTGDRQLIALAPAAIRYRPTIVLIAPGSRSVKSMQWSHILAENPDFCLPHLHSTPPLWRFLSENCHAVWYRRSSSAVAKRPRDASRLSVVSYNSTKRRVESFIVSYVGYKLSLRAVKFAVVLSLA